MRVQFGEYVFDSALRTLTRRREPVGLTPKAFALLEILISARPAPVSRETLYDRLWPQTFVEPGNLHNLVAEIRAALHDDEHEIVTTSRGFGYAFAGAGTVVGPSRFAAAVGRDIFPLHDGENIIGRDPAAAIYVDSPDVSRRHARVVVRDSGITVEDLGSKNGTFLNSERLKSPRALGPGDTIVIGRVRIDVREIGDSTVTG
jgi:DNA-binding winged helix-turn-helix (wHTH) protein